MFFFNDDALQSLDAYQRWEEMTGSPLDGASRSGDKKVAGILNMGENVWSWSDINSFQRLSERVSDLMEEHPDNPVMTGTCHIRAGRDRTCTLELTPLGSRIVLHSLCTDFHARPYRDAALEDADIYLVNVNRSIGLFDDGSATSPSCWLSMGEREEGAPLFHLDRIRDTVFPDIALYCYPNSATEDRLGCPMTRLVIEATLLGERYFYPIDLPGIGRNESLILDATITRTGTTGPDCPAATGSVQCTMHVLPWTEKTSWTVMF